ncbi:TPA: helix-turn-helix transcriptional regulator [Morganella morganii]|nr:helix-turn-helix transcriptional regulator [Morganella morganii]
MSTIGIRLKTERERLGLNQTDFAKLAGYSRSAQASYERDEKTPGGEYLQKIAEHGCDILYILTGQLTEAKSISEEENKLISNYRAMDEAARLNMQAVSSAFAQQVTSGGKNKKEA